MKYISYFMVLAICLNSCKQSSADEELIYRLTSYKFLQLLDDGKKDSAMNMIVHFPEDRERLINRFELIQRFLHESKRIPDYKTFSFDSVNIKYTKKRIYEINLYKDGQNTDPNSFVGSIDIEFRDGFPQIISEIRAIAKPSKL